MSLGALAFGVALALPGTGRAAEPLTTPTFTKDIAPILQKSGPAIGRTRSRRCLSKLLEDAWPPGHGRSRQCVSPQMPPWHIDKTVGIQKFKNDRWLDDGPINHGSLDSAPGAPQGDAKDMPAPKSWPEDQGWNFAAQFGQTAPDMVIEYVLATMKAQQQDAWDKRITETGITEPRWVRAIEIRPKTSKGRRITHHAIAYLEQEEPGAQASFGLPAPFMEWAVRKQGEMMRSDTGSVLYRVRRSAGTSTTRRRARRSRATSNWASTLSEGSRAKLRASLALVPAALGVMDVRPNQVTISQSFTPLRSSARIESFQGICTCGKAMMLEAILPTGRT